MKKNDEPMGQTHISKRKRNGRLVRLVSFDVKRDCRDTIVKTSQSISRKKLVPMLPRNQYTTTLRRRAIRKSLINMTNNADIYGDISLGMKLIVAGGRVIVQSVTSLSDGSASPAQLVGVIKRGDVLLAIGNLSLANLPVDQLMQGLLPLSAPDSGGLYDRYLDLRFEAAAGFSLLMIHEEEHARSQDHSHTNGTPLFELQSEISSFRPKICITEGNSNENEVGFVEEAKENFSNEMIHELYLNFDSLISAVLAKQRNSDRERYESEYFDLKEDSSDLLRVAISPGKFEKKDHEQMLTKVQRLEIGYRILDITQALESSLEEVDRRRATKFQKNLNSSNSIWSGSSSMSKRQYNSNGTISSIRSSYGDPLDVTIGEESIDSCASPDEVNSDKLLLRLAARDAVWRALIISSLKKAVEYAESNGNERAADLIAEARANESTQKLGFSLFPRNASCIPDHGSESFALPPQQITHMLFQLASYIATNAHDDITVYGANSRISSNICSRQSGTSKAGMIGRAIRSDFTLAKLFILDEALPQWLKTFRPLKADQRKILWPRHISRIESISGTYNGGFQNTRNSSIVKSVTLENIKTFPQEDDDDRVLHCGRDLESETCFLVTYFCTQRIIHDRQDGDVITVDKNSFIDTYGAYLQLRTCLAYASFVKDDKVISDILRIATDDPNHQDNVRAIQKSAEIFYDSNKLSAVLQCLEYIGSEANERRRKMILDLCVSGYPDIQPWQVRTACLCFSESQLLETRDNCSTNILEDLYYTYLCYLLDPMNGNESAREDLGLQQEFCEWSIGLGPRKYTNSTRMENFMNIASNYRNSYRRDLMMLLNLSTTINNHDLSLDLAEEIIRNAKLRSNEASLRGVRSSLRKIGDIALDLCSNTSEETVGFEILQRVSSLFEKLSTSKSHLSRKLINVPNELLTLFAKWKFQHFSSGDDATMYHLIDFVINVSSAPADVVKALLLWSSDHFGNSLLARLETLLCRSITFSLENGDFSGTLFRLKEARKASSVLFDSIHEIQDVRTGNAAGIWMSMEKGLVSIDK